MVANNIGEARERRQIERQRDMNIDIALDPDDPNQLPAHPVKSVKPQRNEKLEKLEKVFHSPDPVLDMEDGPGTSKAEDAAEVFRKPIGVQPTDSVVQPVEGAPAEEPPMPFTPKPVEHKQPFAEPAAKEVQLTMMDEPPQDGEYHFPPVSMLETTKATDETEIAHELQTNGRMLVETLKSFGVQTKILDICRGPAVTRYELQPAAGVKISKITNLADDIALNLAASGVRIEAPIPGKAAVGIEVPNKKVSTVRMRELIESTELREQPKATLTVALGRDIAGKVTVADLAKMPHLLIAGATGSGKSVCINSHDHQPAVQVHPGRGASFLMIDPKVVELGIYNGIPHLLVPVVTDPQQGGRRPELGGRRRCSTATSSLRTTTCATWRAITALARRGYQDETAADAAHAADRHHHRRAGRPDDGRPQRGGGCDLPPGADGPRRGHAPGHRHPAPVGGRHHRHHQGQHPQPHRVCRFLAGGLPHHSGHAAARKSCWAGAICSFRRWVRPSPSASRAALSATARSNQWSTLSRKSQDAGYDDDAWPRRSNSNAVAEKGKSGGGRCGRPNGQRSDAERGDQVRRGGGTGFHFAAAAAPASWAMRAPAG